MAILYSSTNLANKSATQVGAFRQRLGCGFILDLFIRMDNLTFLVYVITISCCYDSYKLKILLYQKSGYILIKVK